MKKIMLLLVITISSNVFAYEVNDLCFFGVDRPNAVSFDAKTHRKSPEELKEMYTSGTLKMMCNERDELSRNFRKLSLYFTAWTIAAGVCPEPIGTKISASVLAFGSLAMGSISMYVQGLDCEDTTMLNNAQKEQVVKAICKELGKDYVAKPQPHCDINL